MEYRKTVRKENLLTVATIHKLFIMNGGAEGIRTPDPHNAIVVLYQLSYDPGQCAPKSKVLRSFVKNNLIVQSKLNPARWSNHRLMPGRIPHDIDLRVFDSRKAQNLLLRIPGNRSAHPATRRG